MGLLDDPEARLDQEMVDLGYAEAPVEEVEQEPPTESDGTYSEPQTQEDEVRELDEVERRMSKALLYKQLLSGDLFGDADELAQEVDKEIKSFVRDRCRELLGMQAAKPQVQLIKQVEVFTDQEVQALKSMANRIINSSPAVQKMAGLPKVAPKPVLKPQPVEIVKKPAPKPVLRSREIPQELQQPKVKPVIKNEVKPKPVVKNSKFPLDDDVVEERGQKFKIKHVETVPDNYSLTDANLMRRMSDGQVITLSDNTQILKSGGSWVRATKKPAVINTQEGFPTLNPKQLEIFSANQAGVAASRHSKSQLVQQILK